MSDTKLVPWIVFIHSEESGDKMYPTMATPGDEDEAKMKVLSSNKIAAEEGMRIFARPF